MVDARMYREVMDLGLARPVVVTDTITRLEAELGGTVIVSASHGGRSSGLFALAVPLAGVIFNDAGGGRDGAGIAGLAILQRAGVPAAVLAHDSAEIGNGRDGWACGIVSGLNAFARGTGVRAGMSAQEAASLLARHNPTSGAGGAPPRFSRSETEAGGLPVTLLDSVSMVSARDRGRIVVTGSHGGMIAGEQACEHPPRLVVFNDAGSGKNAAGTRGLALLEEKGIAAAAVGHETARIGEPGSTLRDGIVTAANAAAAAMGLRPGEPIAALIGRMTQGETQR